MTTCYRHSDRETGVSCSNCDRPICPDCMTPTPVGMRCPECSRERTRVIRPRDGGAAGGVADAPVTHALIAISVIVFLLDLVAGGSVTRGFGGELTSRGALFGPAVADGEYWRLVTSGFLHAGLFHVGFNMLVLYMLGPTIEAALGRIQFAATYFAALVCGSLGSLFLQPNAFVVGASGAVFGLMAAAFLVARSRGVSVMDSGIGGLIVINLLITFAVPGIAKGGHLGGLVGGAIAAYLLIELGARGRRVSGPGVRRRLAGQAALALVVLITLVAFVASIVVANAGGL